MMQIKHHQDGLHVEIQIRCKNPHEEVVLTRELERIIASVILARESDYPIDESDLQGGIAFTDLINNADDGDSAERDMEMEFAAEKPFNNSLKSWHK